MKLRGVLLLFYLTCDGPGPRASRHCARPSPHISIFHAEQPFARPNRPHLLSLPAASAPQLQQRPRLSPPLFNAHARSPSPSSLHWIARCVAHTRILPTWQAGPVPRRRSPLFSPRAGGGSSEASQDPAYRRARSDRWKWFT